MELFADVVQTLAFKEDHRIGPVKRRGHQPLGVVRGDREDDLEAGNLRNQRGPVLRVLGTVLGTDRDADDDGHLEDAGRHRLPLRQLVEHFVTSPTEEVAVHQFDDDTTATHGVADGRTDDRGFGDRRVEQAVVRQRFGQAAIDGKRAAPVAVLFAVGDQRGIFVELVDQRFEDGVAVLIDLVLGNRLAGRVEGKAFLLGDGHDTRVLFLFVQDVGLAVVHPGDLLLGEHDAFDGVRRLEQVHARRHRRIGRHLHDVGDVLDDPGVERGKLVVAGHAGSDQLLPVGGDRVVFHPGVLFFLGTVGVGVRRRVTGVAVGQRIEQDRALLAAQDVELAPHGFDHRQRVVAVDAFGVHLFGINAGTDAREEVVAHRFAARLAAHRVLVVHHIQQERHAALHVAFPEVLVLVHGGHHQAFPDRAAGHRAVADVADDDAVLAVDLLVQRRTDRDVGRAADDGVVGVNTERQEEGVHRAAKSLVEAGFLGEDFSQRAVKQEVDRGVLDRLALAFVELLDDFVGGATEELFHDLGQFGIRQLVDRREALGQDFTVAAVRTEDEVVDRQEIGLTNRRGFLPHRQVRRTRVVVFDAVVGIGRLDRVQHRLEFADIAHVAIDAQEVILRELLLLLFNRLLVLVNRNLVEFDVAGLTHLGRINMQMLGHFGYLGGGSK